jgi:hypothetical protein
MRRVV